MPKFYDPANFPHKGVERVTIYGSILTLTGSSGTANITINGILNGTIATFASNLTTTAANWVTANYAQYYKAGFVITSAAAVITVVPRYGFVSVNSINVTIANVTSDLNGTLVGVLSCDFSKAKRYQVTFGQNINIAAAKGLRDGDRIRLELKATGAYSTTWATDSWFFPGGTENVQTSTSLDLVNGVFNVDLFPRIDRVTLTGSSGTANVTAGGLIKLATWNTSLTQTATDFVTAHAAAYLLVGLVLTSAAAVLSFTATTKATGLYQPASVANVTTDLAGTIAVVPEGRVCIEAAAQDIKQ